MFVDRPGDWLADQVRGQRVGVYGREYVMTVRDFESLNDAAGELVSWDEGFDHARAVKSELELESVRESVRINTEGFWIFLEEFAPGKTEREILAPCEEYFVREGCGRLTMDMVLTGPNGSALPEFKIAGDYRIQATDMVLPSLEIAVPAATGSKCRAPSAPVRRAPSHSRCSTPTRSTTLPRRLRSGTAPLRMTSIALSPRGSSSEISSSATSRAIRSGDDHDRVAEDRRGRRDRAP